MKRVYRTLEGGRTRRARVLIQFRSLSLHLRFRHPRLLPSLIMIKVKNNSLSQYIFHSCVYNYYVLSLSHLLLTRNQPGIGRQEPNNCSLREQKPSSVFILQRRKELLFLSTNF